METETKNFKLYEEYRKIPFNKICDMEKYVTEKLKRGHAIIQILVNEDKNSIDELISYANASEEESWYITTNNVINNIANNRPTVTFGDIHVTCPGVTEQQVARYIPSAVKEELNKEFNGFSNYTDQWVRR